MLAERVERNKQKGMTKVVLDEEEPENRPRICMCPLGYVPGEDRKGEAKVAKQKAQNSPLPHYPRNRDKPHRPSSTVYSAAPQPQA